MAQVFKIILIILSPLIVSFALILVNIAARLIYYFGIKKEKMPKRGQYKEPSFFSKIFLQFPRQFIDDLRHKQDYEFEQYGVHIICGEQGSGKTTTVVYLLNKWLKMYPHCRVSTNMAYKHESSSINHWKDIVSDNNGILGKVEVLDEIQTWFSSNQSKDFPPEMLQEVSQQRKQRKAIIGTAQVFSRMSKPLREQTHFVYLPMTLFGCITIVRKSHAKYWNDEKQTFNRYTGFFFFVHTPEIRDAFDTYKKIEKYSETGFIPTSERLTDGYTVVNRA
jgi:hypothetical protein